jgi:simple sugar transport system ATP-binding protein
MPILRPAACSAGHHEQPRTGPAATFVEAGCARADRVAVLYDGRVTGSFPRAEVDRERIGALMAEDGDRDGRQEEIG